MSETEVEMDDAELPDDESTIDPELTSAADTGWLAEMRATAKGRRQTLAETLDAATDAETTGSESELDSLDGDVEADDEMTITGTDAFAEIRAAAAAARAATEPLAATEPAAASEPVAAAAEPVAASESVAAAEPVVAAAEPVVATETEAAATDVLAPPTEASARGATAPPDLHQPPNPPAPLSPSSARVPSAPRTPTESPSRWEPPQRLSTAKTPDTPVLSLTEKTGRVLDWKLAVAGVIVALMLGFLVARLLTGDPAPDPVDPDGDVVTTIAAVDPDQ